MRRYDEYFDQDQTGSSRWPLRLQRESRIEMEADGLTELDVAESVLNAVAIYKRIRSQSPYRKQERELLYVIQSTNLEGLMIYTKGKLVKESGLDTYYFFVSSKKAV